MPQNEEASVQDDIAASIKELSTATPAPSPTPSESKEPDITESKGPVDEMARREGRAQPKPEEEAAEEEHAETVARQPKKETKEKEEWSAEKAPQSWNPAAREKWAALPEDIRKEIVRREQASVQGVRALQERFEPLQRFAQDLTPVFKVSRDLGVHPMAYISSLMNTERLLSTGSVQAKFGEIMRIAEQFGVPLRDIINKSVGEEILQAPQGQQGFQVPPQVDQRLAALEQQRSYDKEQSYTREIDSFSEGKEFFEDVREDMATLVESGAAESLAEAYDKACWASPSVRKVLLERERKKEQADELRGRQAAARELSIPSGGSLETPGGGEADDSLEQTVRRAWVANSGRV